MVDNLTDQIYRDLNLRNSDANHNHNQHYHGHQPQQSKQSLPLITTTDYSDQSSLVAMRVSQSSAHRKNSDAGYDTDGGIGTTPRISKSHHHLKNAYEHFVSPRLPTKRSAMQSSKQLPLAIASRQNLSPQSYLSVTPSLTTGQHRDDRDDDSTYEGDANRRHIRLSRRIPRRSPSTKNHGPHTNHPTTISRHEAALANTTSGRPFKLIFIRHSERVNQVLGPDWFNRAFRTNTYQPYDPNLPLALPKRHSDQAYEFDVPLTVHGLKNARHTGRMMLNSNLAADICLSSTALRCIQTAERILTGMDRIDRIPIRIEPGLYECPHINFKIIESFMTKKELVDNGYKIKVEYKPLIPKISVPESLDEYFDRCVTVMRGIIDRYGHHGGNLLIVTHAPGILALTDAIQGKRPHNETFYRTVAAYPPLATYIFEYDGTKWKHSDQPFLINSHGQS